MSQVTGPGDRTVPAGDEGGAVPGCGLWVGGVLLKDTSRGTLGCF